MIITSWTIVNLQKFPTVQRIWEKFFEVTALRILSILSRLRETESCKVACRIKLDAVSAKNFKDKIDDDYRVNMILDNLPVAVPRRKMDGSGEKVYERGFQVGFKGRFAGEEREKLFYE
uniref:Transmembrane 9 superfamily member 7-like isoform X2 n=1 Tax=Nicotiana tabacum TaxID=4097 RepID=A0A1S4AI51_TOBAC|nr:PREDICTED: transmembrane 9 superfamily member 7-like isoform X2 [Nicotiana tabacum]